MTTEEALLKVKVEDNASVPLQRIADKYGRLRDEKGRFIKGSGNAQKAFSGNAASAKGFGAALTSLDPKMIAISGSVFGAALAAAALTAAFAATATATVASVRAFVAFEESLTRAEAVTSDATGKLKEMRAAAIDAGLATTFSATNAAQAMTKLGMSGFTAAEQIAAVKPVLDLANIGNMELARTAEIASNVLKAYKFQASDLAGVNDKMAKTFTSSNTTLETLGESFEFVGTIAKDTGQDFDSLLAQMGALGNVGIQGSKAGTGLRAALVALAKPGAEGAAVLKQLGVETLDSSGKVRQLTDVIEDLAANGATTSDTIAIFGKVGGTAISALTADVEGIKKLTSEIKNSNGAAAAMAETINSSLGAQAKILSGTVETLGIQIGAQFRGSLIEATKALTEQAAAMAKDDDLMKDVATSGKVLLSVFAQLLRVTADMVVAFGHIGGAMLEASKHGEKVVGVLREITLASAPMAGLARDAQQLSEAMGLTSASADKAGGAYAGAVRSANKLADSMRKVADATDPAKNGIKALRKELGALARDAMNQSNMMLQDGATQLGAFWKQLNTTAEAYTFTAREARELAQVQDKEIAARKKRMKVSADAARALNHSIALKRADLAIVEALTDVQKVEMQQARALLTIQQSKGTALEKNLQRQKIQIQFEERLQKLDATRAKGTREIAASLAIEEQRTKVLTAQSKREQISAQFSLSLLQSKQQLATVEDETLRKRRMGNAELAAEAAARKSIADLEKTKAADKKKADKEAEDELKKQTDEILKIADAFDSLDQTGSAALAHLGDGLKDLTQLGVDLQAVMKASAESTAAAGKASATALSTAGQAVAGFAAALGASAVAQAAILATFETGAALASFAAGDLIGGAGHLAAAATFGIVAGTSASSTSGGGSGGSAAGAGAVGATGTQASPQQGAEIFAEALASRLESGTNGTIVFDMRDSMVVGDEGFMDRMDSAARTRGIELDDLRR